MSLSLHHARIVARRSADRGHANHGWLDTFHTFSFANYQDATFQNFGALRVLNEDRVAPKSGFPTHTHRNAEIFSYIISGELTHRDSMMSKGSATGASKDQFYRIQRGDVQFTTGGSGISHSEHNEHASNPVHFLQIWAIPWKKDLTPKYHDLTVSEHDKRQGFVIIISPLKAGVGATEKEEETAVPVVEGTIPIHADVLMGAAIIDNGSSATWVVGNGGSVESKRDRHVYVHLPMTNGGRSKIRLPDATVLGEGDGAFISNINDGDSLQIESVGVVEAEVVVLDSA
ncbi:MAG: hypothetical protein Q9201_007899 [Fulgogasparrea decipioides]